MDWAAILGRQRVWRSEPKDGNRLQHADTLRATRKNGGGGDQTETTTHAENGIIWANGA